MWPAPNTSGGFLESLKSKWDELAPDARDVLLVGEGLECKLHMQSVYPSWRVTTVDMFIPEPNGPDIRADICHVGSVPALSYDLIINQANLEHVYDPFGAMRNLTQALRVGGVHVIHTHLPGMPYHAVPRDYFRFMTDWFQDLPERLEWRVQVVELWTDPEINVFAAYKRVFL